MKVFQRILKFLSILMVVGLMLIPASVSFATNVDRPLTDREKAAFIVRDEWTAWVKGFTASLSELDKNATSRIYTNMDYYDMQYRFTEKYKKVPEYLDEDGKPTQKLKDLIKEKRKELNGAKARDGFLAFTSTQNGSSVSYTITGSLPNLNIGYSYDMVSWTKWDAGSSITLDNNETIYVWNKSNTLSVDDGNLLSFDISGSINASGNVNSLINFKEDVPDYSFYCLFFECSDLKQAPELPATTVGNFAYASMFSRCRGLISAPELQATNIGNSCYAGMFSGCNHLTNAPTILPATVLKEACYAEMFRGCAFTTAPLLPATTLVADCYNRIFDGCTNLNYIELAYKGVITTANFNNWVNDVADSGEILYDGPTATFGASAIPKDGSNRWIITQSPTELRFLANEASTIKYVINGIVAPRISYSSDRTTWTDWDADTDINLAVGDEIYVKNSNINLSTNTSNYVQFVMTGNLSGGGDISSMIDYSSVRHHSFYGLFKDCTSLVSSPLLPATEIAESCYEEMFKGCTNLVQAPELPATTLAENCYKSMFEGTGITTAPELIATTLVNGCYEKMFKNCSALNYIKIVYSGDITGSYFTDWVEGVADTGTFYYTGEYREYGQSAIPKEDINGKRWIVRESDYLVLESVANTSSVQLVKSNDSMDLSGIRISYNEKTWTTWDGSQLTINNGQKVFVRNANNTFSASDTVYGKFVMTGSIKCYGNIYAMIKNSSLSNWCFYKLFEGCSAMTTAPKLEATTLATSCYQNMFASCTGLTKAPELPATTLAQNCYYGMFKSCNNLTSAPSLPATALANSCYSEMFSGCSNLVQAPELPATTLASNCYYGMFKSCNNLTSAPALPVTTLANSCYSEMFSGCGNLVQAPELPATTLAQNCYYGMFKSCNNLTSAPSLPATTLVNSCYSEMFSGCSNLVQAPELPATTLAQNCYYGMFKSCNNLTSAPALPVTTLANSCYSEMFSGCSNLARAPELPATTLSQNCYASMFKNCSQLSYIKIGYKGNFNATYFNNWVDGVANSGTFAYGGPYLNNFGNSAIPKDSTNKWKVEIPYLTFISRQNGSTVKYITHTGYSAPAVTTSGIQTSTDGVNWSSWNGSAKTLSSGSVLFVKNTNNTLSGMYSNLRFLFTGQIEAAGNVNSMINYEDVKEWCFYYLFAVLEGSESRTSLVSVENLILPSTTLAWGCYANMFYYQEEISKAPYLPAPTLVSRCYESLFYGCKNLSYINLAYTGEFTESNPPYTSRWVQGVKNSGTFVYGGTNNTRGYSSIPGGWTVVASD